MSIPESTTAEAANPTVTIGFSKTHAPNKPAGEIGEGSLLFTIVTQNGQIEVPIQIGVNGTTPGDLAAEVAAALKANGITATVGGTNNTAVTFEGAANNPISSVTVDVGGNSGVTESHSGGSVTINQK